MYISKELLLEINNNLDINGMNNFLEIAGQINDYHHKKDYPACLISIRTLTEYVCGIYAKTRLADILDSPLWKKNTHSDQNHYITILKSIEKITQVPEDEAKEKLQLIESSRLYANNHLHPSPEKHSLILTKESLPPCNQIHLLISLGFIGLINKSKLIKENTITAELWKPGIEIKKIDSALLYNHIWNNEELPEEIKNIEAVKIAIYICKGEFKDLERYLKGLLAKTEEQDLNRWAQIKIMIVCITLLKNNTFEYALKNLEPSIKKLKKIYQQVDTKLPHIASLVAFYIHVQCSNIFYKGSESPEAWSCIKDQLQLPVTTSHSVDFNIIYNTSINISTGRISSESPLNILHNGIEECITAIVKSCSYGFITDINNNIEKLLKIIMIQSQLVNTHELNNLNYSSTIKVLSTAVRLNVKNTTVKEVIKAFSSYSSKKELIDIFRDSIFNSNILPTALNDLIDEAIPILPKKELLSLQNKFFLLYKNKHLPTPIYDFIHPSFYKDKLLTFWLNTIVYNDDIPEIQLDYLVNKLEAFLDSRNNNTYLILNILNKEKYFSYHEKIKDLILEKINMTSTKQGNSSELYIYFFLSFGGDLEIIKSRINNIFDLWYHYPKEKYSNLLMSYSAESILDSFSKEVDRINSTQGYSSRDFIKNNLVNVVLKLIKFYKEDHFFLIDRLMEQIVKLIKSKPMTASFLTGHNISYFLYNLYELANIEEQSKKIKEPLFAAIQETITDLKIEDAKIYHYETKLLSINIIEFYKVIIASKINNTTIRSDVFYSIILNLKYFSAANELPWSFYLLYNNLDIDQKKLLLHNIFNLFLLDNKLDSISKKQFTYIINAISKKENNCFFKDIYNQYKNAFPPSLCEVLEND